MTQGDRSQTRLWRKVAQDPSLTQAIIELRRNCAALADRVAATVPDFTDHSVRHMDSLWGVADEVLTEQETALLSIGEAFLSATGFYLHDIGMALAATPEGLERISNPRLTRWLRRLSERATQIRSLIDERYR